MFKKLLLSILVLTVVITHFFIVSPAQAALNNLTDTINNDDLYGTADHIISFTLPGTSAAIQTTDYIQIYLPYFTSLTEPTSVSGTYSGTASFSSSGQYLRVTGIGVSPGSSLTINGITADNPGSPALFTVVVSVTSDEAGTIILESSQTTATSGGDSVTVNAVIETEQSTLIITGYTSPGAFLTFTEQASVLGTTLAGVSGYFSKTFPGLQPATHTVTIFSVDTQDLISAPHIVTTYTPVFTETTVSNILLSSSIAIDSTDVLTTEDLVATGSAVPGGQVTVFTSTPLRSYNASAGADGTWNYTIDNISSYVVGDYSIYTIVQDLAARQSLSSITLGFSVLESTSSGGSSCGDISQGDLNCDSSVNLTDFSVLMYYWGTSDAAADINEDGVVNLTDFSVLMYYWGT